MNNAGHDEDIMRDKKRHSPKPNAARSESEREIDADDS